METAAKRKLLIERPPKLPPEVRQESLNECYTASAEREQRLRAAWRTRLSRQEIGALVDRQHHHAGGRRRRRRHH